MIFRILRRILCGILGHRWADSDTFVCCTRCPRQITKREYTMMLTKGKPL